MHLHIQARRMSGGERKERSKSVLQRHRGGKSVTVSQWSKLWEGGRERSGGVSISGLDRFM